MVPRDYYNSHTQLSISFSFAIRSYHARLRRACHGNACQQRVPHARHSTQHNTHPANQSPTIYRNTRTSRCSWYQRIFYFPGLVMGRRWWGGRPARPGPARPVIFSRGWAAARPSPSNLQSMESAPAQPITFSKFHGLAPLIIFSKVSARPGPAHHMAARPMRHGLYMDRPDNYVGRPVDLTGRPMGVIPYYKVHAHIIR